MNSIKEQYQSVCRTCLAEKENMKCIFNIAHIITTCSPIQLEPGDGLPAKICVDCVTQAHQAYEFRLQCEQSDNVLRKKLLKHHIVLIKSDIYDADSPESCRENSFSPVHSPTEEKQMVPLKIEHDSNLTIQNTAEDSNKTENTFEVRNKRLVKKGQKSVGVKNESTETNDSEQSDDEENGDEHSTDAKLSCRFCDMKFRYKIRLKKHEQKHLHGLKCHICQKDFPTIKQLNNHINIHSRKGAHLCQTCGKQFTLPENLVRHQRIHAGVRPYKCHLCSKTFTQSNELKSHLVTHSSEKHHLCSVCGNKYSRSISLKVHMRRIHSLPPNTRPYICAVCGRNFKDRRDLSQHMLIHTGERSHVCKVCNKAFNRSSNLRVHERIHTGHKPYVCPVCQRAFIQKHVLNTHMRTHPKSV